MINKVINIEKLSELQEEIEKMQKKAEKASKQICEELSEYGLEKMEKIYNEFELTGSEKSVFYIEGTENYKKIVMEGPQAIYDEFGTGTEGERSPHPIKNQFSLNDYNSGKTIRKATGFDMDNALLQGKQIPIGGLFWTYIDSFGNKIYTQGTPAQKEGYDSLIETSKKSPTIIKKVMKEVMFND